MSESEKGNSFIIDDSSLSVTLTVGQLKALVREEIEKAVGQNGHHQADRLLDAKEAAEILSVSEDWLYRRKSKLPFTRRLGPKMLRFSFQGIQKYLAAKTLT